MAQSRKKKADRDGKNVAVTDSVAKRVSVRTFLSEVKTEFGKISWPTRKQTISSTVVVIVMSTLVAFYLGAVDLLLGKLVGFILD